MFLRFVVETERFKKINERFRRRPNSAKDSHRKIHNFDLFIIIIIINVYIFRHDALSAS